jgi:hypothetical protein
VRQLLILETVLKQHNLTQSDTESNRRLPLIRAFQVKTCFSHRFFLFIGLFLYKKLNKLLSLLNLNRLSYTHSPAKVTPAVLYGYWGAIIAIILKTHTLTYLNLCTYTLAHTYTHHTYKHHTHIHTNTTHTHTYIHTNTTHTHTHINIFSLTLIIRIILAIKLPGSWGQHWSFLTFDVSTN